MVQEWLVHKHTFGRVCSRNINELLFSFLTKLWMWNFNFVHCTQKNDSINISLGIISNNLILISWIVCCLVIFNFKLLVLMNYFPNEFHYNLSQYKGHLKSLLIYSYWTVLDIKICMLLFKIIVLFTFWCIRDFQYEI